MEGFLELLRTSCLILVFAILAFFVIRFLIVSIHIVNQGEQVVIERLGKFVRVSGPGPVWVTPRLEQIARRIETRTTGEVYGFTDVWFQSFLPFTIQLALSYSLNLGRLPFALQRDLAYYTRQEWQDLTKAHIARELQDILPKFEFVQLIGHDPAFRKQFETMLRDQLQTSLCEYGMLLSDYHSVELKAVRLPEPLRESLMNITRTDIDARTRSAVLDTIIQKYPGLSEAFLISVASILTGQQLGGSQMLPPIIFQNGVEPKPASDIKVETPGLPGKKERAKALDKPDDSIWRILKLPPARRIDDEQVK